MKDIERRVLIKHFCDEISAGVVKEPAAGLGPLKKETILDRIERIHLLAKELE